MLQREFPLDLRPFEAIAQSLGISPADVIERVLRLKRDGIIRQIGAIFDSAALGYASSLVAFKVRPDMLDAVAGRVAEHPGVSHCYSRDADYNLWFTITAAPGVDMEREIRVLASTPGVTDCLILPTVKLFKIGVFLDMTGDGNAPGNTQARQRHTKIPQGQELAAVRALQKDLPIVEAPFDSLAKDAGMTDEELLSHARRFLDDGRMRRFAAVLRHTDAGFRANAMVCWNVEEERIDEAGEALARHASVSHCYQRPASPKWPYPLYSMVHCRTEDELAATIRELAASASPVDYRVLRTVKEYKKTRVRYFGVESFESTPQP